MMKYTNVTQNPDGTYNIHYEDGTQRQSDTAYSPADYAAAWVAV